MERLEKYGTVSELLMAMQLFNENIEGAQELDDIIFTYALLYKKEKSIFEEKFTELMAKK